MMDQDTGIVESRNAPGKFEELILVVDDDEQIKKLLHYFLTSKGYMCETASNGRDALEMAEKFPFDTVITDIKMPEVDGIALTRLLTAKYPDLRVMVMTGFTPEYSEEDAVDAGASDFIKKPFTLTEFSARLHRIIRDRQRICGFKGPAYYDELTGLPNRMKFLERMKRSLEYARRYPHMLTLLFWEPDNFKALKDAHGHDTGNALLRKIASMIGCRLRETDTIARMDSEEFAVLARIGRKEDAAVIADRIVDVLSRPVEIETLTLLVGCSIGISLFPSDGKEAEDLLNKADSAMYRVKAEGGSGYRYYGELAGKVKNSF